METKKTLSFQEFERGKEKQSVTAQNEINTARNMVAESTQEILTQNNNHLAIELELSKEFGLTKQKQYKIISEHMRKEPLTLANVMNEAEIFFETSLAMAA